MQKSTSGFTVIELIVIIVVIGIIAAITIVSYNSFQRSIAHNERVTELRGWRATFEKYRAAKGEYPSFPVNGIYCLGTDFPNDRCSIYSGDSTTATEQGSAALMAALAPYDPPVTGPREEVATTGRTPPYVQILDSYFYLRTILEFPGSADQQCPADLERFSTSTSTSGGQTTRIITCQFVVTNW